MFFFITKGSEGPLGGWAGACVWLAAQLAGVQRHNVNHLARVKTQLTRTGGVLLAAMANERRAVQPPKWLTSAGKS